MSTKVMPIAGKAEDRVTAVKVEEDGAVNTTKKWINKIVTVYDEELRTDVAITTSVENEGGISLRITNSTDVPIEFIVYDDAETGNKQMRDASFALIKFTVPASTNFVLITPDDVPALFWVSNLRLRVGANTIPTTGRVTVRAVVKG